MDVGVRGGHVVSALVEGDTLSGLLNADGRRAM